MARVVDRAGNDILVELMPGTTVDAETGRVIVRTTGTPSTTGQTTTSQASTTTTEEPSTTTEDPTTTLEEPTTTAEDTVPPDYGP